MSQVFRRPQAAEDIEEIWNYIADESFVAANRWFDRLDAQLRLLAKNPKLGRSRDELLAGLRSFPLERYVIFYIPLRDGVDVVRVLHGARDIPEQFEE